MFRVEDSYRFIGVGESDEVKQNLAQQNLISDCRVNQLLYPLIAV